MTVRRCVRCGGGPMRPDSGRVGPPGYRTHAGNGLCDSCYRITRAAALPGTHGSTGSLNDPADPVVVDRVLDGQRTPMNRAERLEVVRIATARGWSARDIARATGLAPRSVCRIRADLRRLG